MKNLFISILFLTSLTGFAQDKKKDFIIAAGAGAGTLGTGLAQHYLENLKENSMYAERINQTGGMKFHSKEIQEISHALKDHNVLIRTQEPSGKYSLRILERGTPSSQVKTVLEKANLKKIVQVTKKFDVKLLTVKINALGALGTLSALTTLYYIVKATEAYNVLGFFIIGDTPAEMERKRLEDSQRQWEIPGYDNEIDYSRVAVSEE